MQLEFGGDGYYLEDFFFFLRFLLRSYSACFRSISFFGTAINRLVKSSKRSKGVRPSVCVSAMSFVMQSIIAGITYL